MKKKVSKISYLVVRFFSKIGEDHVSAYSAMSAYFMLMSFVPFTMFLLSLTTYLPFSKKQLLNLMTHSVLVEENPFLVHILKEIYLHSSSAIVGITIISILWAASKGVWAIIKGMNSVYDIEETRNPVYVRIIAILYTIMFTVMIIISLVLLVFGTTIYTYILHHYPMLHPLGDFIIALKSFFSIFVLTVFFLFLYIVIPNRKTSIREELIGAIFASLGWSVFSYGFSIYVSRFSNYTHIYGGLGGILLFLLWLYMIMFIMFMGAEINFCLSDRGLQKLLNLFQSDKS